MKRIVSVVVLLTVLVGACTGFADASRTSAMMDECTEALRILIERYETNHETFDDDYVYMTCVYVNLYLSLKHGNAADMLMFVKDHGLAYTDEPYITTEKPCSVTAEAALVVYTNKIIINLMSGNAPDASEIKTLIGVAEKCLEDNDNRKE